MSYALQNDAQAGVSGTKVLNRKENAHSKRLRKIRDSAAKIITLDFLEKRYVFFSKIPTLRLSPRALPQSLLEGT